MQNSYHLTSAGRDELLRRLLEHDRARNWAATMQGILGLSGHQCRNIINSVSGITYENVTKLTQALQLREDFFSEKTGFVTFRTGLFRNENVPLMDDKSLEVPKASRASTLWRNANDAFAFLNSLPHYRDADARFKAAFADEALNQDERWRLKWFHQSQLQPLHSLAERVRRFADGLHNGGLVAIPLDAAQRRMAAIDAIMIARRSVSAVSIISNDRLWDDESYLKANVDAKMNRPKLEFRRLVVMDRRATRRAKLHARKVLADQERAKIEIRCVTIDELHAVAKGVCSPWKEFQNVLIVDETLMTRSNADAKDGVGEIVLVPEASAIESRAFDDIWRRLVRDDRGKLRKPSLAQSRRK